MWKSSLPAYRGSSTLSETLPNARVKAPLAAPAVFERRGVSVMERVDTRNAMHKLTALEADAALNAMHHSPHARLRVSCGSGHCAARGVAVRGCLHARGARLYAYMRTRAN